MSKLHIMLTVMILGVFLGGVYISYNSFFGAGKKISELTEGTTVNPTDSFVIVQSGETKKIAFSDLINSLESSGYQGLERAIAYNPYATSTPVFYGGLTASDINATGTITGTNLIITNLYSLAGNIKVGGVNASSTINLSGASGLTASTGAVPTTTSLTIGGSNYSYYAFNASTTNCIDWMEFRMPKGWDTSLLKPRVTWTATTGTGAVVWRLRSKTITEAAWLGATYGGASYATGTLGVGYYPQEEVMDNHTIPSSTADALVKFEVCRMGAQGGDTLGADAYLELVDLKYGRSNYSD